MSAERIRVYFQDNHHELSYLSFEQEHLAAAYVRTLNTRVRAITVWEEKSGSERNDPELEARIRSLASKR